MFEKEKRLLEVFNGGSKKRKEATQENLELIQKATENFCEDDCVIAVKRNCYKQRFNRLFDVVSFANAVKLIKMEQKCAELEKKSSTPQVDVDGFKKDVVGAVKTEIAKKEKEDTAKTLDLLGASLVQAIKETKGDELIDFAKDYIKQNYGIVEKKITYVNETKDIKLEEVTHEKFERVLSYIQVDEPLMMVGPAGSGKNILGEQVAKALGFEYYESNAVQQEYQLTGFIDANGVYQETEFYKACKKASEGKDTIFLFDEIDASNPEVLVKFNNALANGKFEFPNETLVYKNKLHFLACANTYGKGASFEYVGRNQIDDASLNRFAQMWIDYSPKIEQALCPDTELLDFIRDFRKCTLDAGIKHIVSYRDIKRLYKLFQIKDLDKIETLKECLTKNLEPNDLNMIINNLVNNQYTKMVKELANA